MKLYRSISLDELAVLFDTGRVEPQFKSENCDSTYSNRIGSVTCWFDDEIAMPGTLGYGFVVEAEIPADMIVGEGVGKYWAVDYHGDRYYKSEKHREVYTRGYGIDHVLDIFFRYCGVGWDYVVVPWWKDFHFWVTEVLYRQMADDILDAIAQNHDVFTQGSEFYDYMALQDEEADWFTTVWGTLAHHTEKMKKIKKGRYFHPVLW